MSESESLVLTDVREGVGWLTLNNPGERNTLTAPMVAGIIAAMDAFEADEASARWSSPAPAARSAPAPTSATCRSATAESLGNDLRGLPARRSQPAADVGGGQRRRRRGRHEPGAGLRRPAGADAAPGSTRASSRSACTPAAGTPGCSCAPSARKRRWRRSCSARCSTAPRRNGSGWSIAASPRTSCSTTAQQFAAGAAVGAARAGDRHEADDPRHGRHRQPSRRRRPRARTAALERAAALVRRAAGGVQAKITSKH